MSSDRTAPVTAYGLLDDDRATLADVAAALLARHGDDPRAGADEGWFAIAVDEAAGGAGGSLADLAVIIEQCGANVAATHAPWAGGLLGPLLAAAGGPSDLLAALIEGTLDVAVPVADPSGLAAQFQLRADRCSGSLLVFGPVNGRVAVPFEDSGTPAMALVEIDDTVEVTPVASIDRSRTLARVTMSGTPIEPAVRHDALFTRWRALASTVAALDAAGAARAALDRTLEYALARHQFGRPIGSFQAYKHRCASALIEMKLAQSLAFRAAAQIDSDPTQALAAGLFATTAAVAVCGEMIQLHGGIGYTWEAGMHAFLKRARFDEVIGHGGDATARALVS